VKAQRFVSHPAASTTAEGAAHACGGLGCSRWTGLEATTVGIRGIRTTPGSSDERDHGGRGRAAAQAHALLVGQLRGTRIAHALGATRPIRPLVVGVVGTALGGGPVSTPSCSNDLLPSQRTTRLAEALSPVTDSAEGEHHPTVPAENEALIVQVPAPSATLLAHPAALGHGALVRAPARQGRSRASPLGLSSFVPSVPVLLRSHPLTVNFLSKPGSDFYGSAWPVTHCVPVGTQGLSGNLDRLVMGRLVRRVGLRMLSCRLPHVRWFGRLGRGGARRRR